MSTATELKLELKLKWDFLKDNYSFSKQEVLVTMPTMAVTDVKPKM